MLIRPKSFVFMLIFSIFMCCFVTGFFPVGIGQDMDLEEKPDWDPDDAEQEDVDEPKEDAPKPLDTDPFKNCEEAMQRMMELMQEQRLHRQATLAKHQEEKLRFKLHEDLFNALSGPTPLAALEILGDLNESTVLQCKDAQGMNPLHRAVRVGCWEVAIALTNLNPHLCNMLSSPGGRPQQWSPLMVCVDAGKSAMEESIYKFLLTHLLEHTSVQTLESRAGNGSNVLHHACSKGMLWTVKKIMYAMYEKGNSTEAAFGQVSALLNQANGRGSGCVPFIVSAVLSSFFS